MIGAYASFHLIDLIRHPWTTNEVQGYTPHRTSLWSQLYGRANSAHFDYWPPSWQTANRAVHWLTRMIFVCALLPAGLLIIGAAGRVSMWIRNFRNREWPFFADTAMLLDLAAAIGLAFIIAYTMRYRDFSTMKAQFLYPALAGYIALFVHGCTMVSAGRFGTSRIMAGLYGVCGAVCVFYCADIATLVVHLAR